jgi:hypothetical protein
VAVFISVQVKSHGDWAFSATVAALAAIICTYFIVRPLSLAGSDVEMDGRSTETAGPEA